MLERHVKGERRAEQRSRIRLGCYGMRERHVEKEQDQDDVNRYRQQIIVKAKWVIFHISIRIRFRIVLIFDQLQRRKNELFAVRQLSKFEQVFQIANDLAAGGTNIVPANKYSDRDDKRKQKQCQTS